MPFRRPELFGAATERPEPVPAPTLRPAGAQRPGKVPLEGCVLSPRLGSGAGEEWRVNGEGAEI